MKILMATMGLDIGGAETHIVELAKELKHQGHDIVVVSNGGVYVPEVTAAGIRHYNAPMHRRNVGDMLRSRRILKDVLLKEKPDLVHAHARIPGEHDKIRAHLHRPTGIFQCGGPSRREVPFAARGHRALHACLQRLQIDPYCPARQSLHFADRLLRGRLRQTLDLRMLHVKQVQDEQIGSHGRGELRVGHISQHGAYCPDSLADQNPALAARHGLYQLLSRHLADLRRCTVQISFSHKIVPLSVAFLSVLFTPFHYSGLLFLCQQAFYRLQLITERFPASQSVDKTSCLIVRRLLISTFAELW